MAQTDQIIPTEDNPNRVSFIPTLLASFEERDKRYAERAKRLEEQRRSRKKISKYARAYEGVVNPDNCSEAIETSLEHLKLDLETIGGEVYDLPQKSGRGTRTSMRFLGMLYGVYLSINGESSGVDLVKVSCRARQKSCPILGARSARKKIEEVEGVLAKYGINRVTN